MKKKKLQDLDIIGPLKVSNKIKKLKISKNIQKFTSSSFVLLSAGLIGHGLTLSMYDKANITPFLLAYFCISESVILYGTSRLTQLQIESEFNKLQNYNKSLVLTKNRHF